MTHFAIFVIFWLIAIFENNPIIIYILIRITEKKKKKVKTSNKTPQTSQLKKTSHYNKNTPNKYIYKQQRN